MMRLAMVAACVVGSLVVTEREARAQAIEVIDASDTFTLGVSGRANGVYGAGSIGAYALEYSVAPATWTPQTNFSFNDVAGSFGVGPTLLAAATGNPGAATGMAQSGGGDFSFAYGVREDYTVQVDAFVSPFDRTDISSIPAPGAGIFAAGSLSVFFRRDSVGAIGIFNGAAETAILDGDGVPVKTGVDDDNWHRLAVYFGRSTNRLVISVDDVVKADLDLATFAGGAYASYSNGAIGMGGEGSDWEGGRVLWFDNVVVGGRLELNPCFTASATKGPAPLSVRFDASCSLTTGSAPDSIHWDFGDGQTADGESVVDHVFAAGRYTVTLTLADDVETVTTSQTIVAYPRVTEYADSFDRLDGPPTGWTVAAGPTWRLEGGQLLVGPTGTEHWIWAGDPPVLAPPESVFEFDFAFLAPGNLPVVGRHGGFQFGCTTPTTRSGASAFSGYFIDWIDRAEDRGVRLTRLDNGVSVMLVAGQGAAAPANPPTTIRVSTEGGRIRVWGDDFLAIDVADDKWRGGHFGFWTWEQGQQVAIDDVLLSGQASFACFAATPGFPLTNDPVTFDGSCSGVFDGSDEIVAWRWDFGDGSAGEGAIVAHAYAAAGSYTVTLEVETTEGETASIAKTVTVSLALAPFADCFTQDGVGDWTQTLGTWTPTGSAIQTVTVGAEAFLYAGNPVRYLPPKFVAEVDWRLVAGSNPAVGRHGGIHFYWNKATTNRFAGDSRGYVLFYIDRASDRGLTLARFNAGGLVTLNPPGGTPSFTEPPLTVRIEVDGARIRVFADGFLAIDALDGTFRDGLFAIWSWQANEILFDDVRIWEMGEAEPAPCPGVPAIAGDCTLDGRTDISDLVCYLRHFFPGFFILDQTRPPAPCGDASIAGQASRFVLDVNGDGRVDLSDTVWLAMYLFMGGAPPVQGAGCFDLSEFLGCPPAPTCP